MKNKKLNMLMVSVLFFLLGNITSIIYMLYEKDKNRIMAYMPVLGFFLVGSCINGIIYFLWGRRECG